MAAVTDAKYYYAGCHSSNDGAQETDFTLYFTLLHDHRWLRKDLFKKNVHVATDGTDSTYSVVLGPAYDMTTDCSAFDWSSNYDSNVQTWFTGQATTTGGYVDLDRDTPKKRSPNYNLRKSEANNPDGVRGLAITLYDYDNAAVKACCIIGNI